MNIVLLVLAVAAAGGGAALLWWRTRMRNELAVMAATETSKARDLARLQPGTQVELKGHVRCPAPLLSDFAQAPSVYFSSQVEREEVYYDRDSEGKERRNTRTTTIYSNARFTACHVEDDTGTATLDLDGADIEAPEVMRGYGLPPNSDIAGGVLGSVAGAVASLAFGGQQPSYRHNESVLSPDIPVYVLGELRPGGIIGKPGPNSANKVFVVSYKSEEERTKSVGWTMFWALVGAILLFALALGLLYGAYKAGA